MKSEQSLINAWLDVVSSRGTFCNVSAKMTSLRNFAKIFAFVISIYLFDNYYGNQVAKKLTQAIETFNWVDFISCATLFTFSMWQKIECGTRCKARRISHWRESPLTNKGGRKSPSSEKRHYLKPWKIGSLIKIQSVQRPHRKVATGRRHRKFSSNKIVDSFYPMNSIKLQGSQINLTSLRIPEDSLYFERTPLESWYR